MLDIKNLDELDKLAFSGAEMPEKLDLIQQLYYQTVRLIYRSYHNGTLKIEQAQAEKLLARKEYNDYVKLHKFALELREESIDRYAETEKLRAELRRRIKDGADPVPVLFGLVEMYSGEAFDFEYDS